MLYYLRKILLALMQCFNGQLTAIELQKYLFLFTRNQETKVYDFVPYQYGCFSFQANQDIATLEKYGYITKDDNKRIMLVKTEDYMMMLDMFDQQYLQQLKNDFGDYSQTDIIRYTYQHYPYYATKSVIANSILADYPEYLEKIENQKRHFADPQLFTIGYEGISLETYINKLIINDIRVLCDVRKNAYSQKYGFSKAQLATACKGVGILYVHVPQLGIDSDKRQDLRSQRDYDLLFDEYERTTLKDNHEALLYVRSLIDTQKRVALTCFEKDPRQCHRSRVAKALMGFEDKNYTLKTL